MNPASNREPLNRGAAAQRAAAGVGLGSSFSTGGGAPSTRPPTTANFAAAARQQHSYAPAPTQSRSYSPPTRSYAPPTASVDYRETNFRSGASDPARHVPAPAFQSLDTPGPRPTQHVAATATPPVYTQPYPAANTHSTVYAGGYQPRSSTIVVHHQPSSWHWGRMWGYNSNATPMTWNTYMLGLLFLPPVIFVALAAPELFVPTVLILAPIGIAALVTMLACRSMCRDCCE